MAASPATATPDALVGAALAASHLRDLPPRTVAELTADARRVIVPAGSTLHREGDVAPHLEVVVTGVLRVFVTAPDGRTMTVRYCRPGAILGAVSLFAVSFALPATIQALVDSELLALQPATVRRLVDRDPRVATALLRELSERVLSFIAEIPSGAFATVRQRVARHLLDLASEHQRGSQLIARVTQQELADAGGTVREVVVRILRELRAAGVVETRREGIVIVAPERLLAETYEEVGTSITAGSGRRP
jgi:CRP/FNR family cyclic AMP-dependent transcriptional regulator